MYTEAYTALFSLFLVGVKAATLRRSTCPDGQNITDLACCEFFDLADDLQTNLFQGECSDEAQEVVRLMFADAIAISTMLQEEGTFTEGGADGSFILFPEIEANYPENAGLSDAVASLIPFLQNHSTIGAGDLTQFAGLVALSNCAGAPQIQFLAGRRDATQPAPEGLQPLASDPVTTLIDRFADAGGFAPDEMVSLLAAHSIGRASHVDPTISDAPFDSTPFTFDSQFFLEVLLVGVGFPGTPNNTGEVVSPLPLTVGQDVGEIRLQSDFLIARDVRTACQWQSFINEQDAMMLAFTQAMEKLIVLGQDVSQLVDCSETLPPVTPPVNVATSFPATTGPDDLEISCDAATFPELSVDPGTTETLIPHEPNETGTASVTSASSSITSVSSSSSTVISSSSSSSISSSESSSSSSVSSSKSSSSSSKSSSSSSKSSTSTSSSASSTSTGSAGNFGSCSAPEIEFGPGLDGRIETSFAPVNIISYPHGSTDDIDTLADFMCNQVATACHGDATAQASCARAIAAANKEPAPSGAQADAFNAVMGFNTTFATIQPVSNNGTLLPFPT